MGRPVSNYLFTLLLTAATCSADLLDFTQPTPFQTAHGLTTATLTYLGHTLTLSAQPTGATLSWNTGFGVSYGLFDEQDEIDYPEVLTVQFAQPEYVQSFAVSRLFLNEGPFGLNDERGRYSIDHGHTWVPFWGTATGNQLIPIGETVSSLRFTVAKRDAPFDEFTLTAIQVPEPSDAGLILVTAVLAGYFYRKRHPTLPY
ncbi:MAG: hypothetical protein R2729_23530 [Bryobacteraceae bacterium]